MEKEKKNTPSMKQISRIVGVVVFAILTVAVIVIINYTSNEVQHDIFGETTKVGLLLVGTKNDRSWSQSHYDALVRVSEELNLEIIAKEGTPTDFRCADTIKSLIENDKCRVIVGSSVEYGSYCASMAKQYPDCTFLNVSSRIEDVNAGSFFGRMYEMRYLSGIIAGNQTKTGHIGFVASFPNSEVNRGINAFTLGVRSVRPDAVVNVAFCNSWNDDAIAEASVNMLIDKCGADVITTHMDSLVVLRTAEERGVWSIGYNCDNSDLFPKSTLTSCVWRWDVCYRDMILSVLQGKFRGEWKWYGIESGIMGLTDPEKTGNAAEGYEQALADARKRFEEHTTDVFYGPITDTEGTLRIAENESMSDEQMYERFDWYVEGVKIEARVR